MPTDRSRQLIFELDAWYRSHAMRQKDLAVSLNMSAQQLAEILALRNRPTGEQALRIVEFLETENMKTDFLDPRTETRVSTHTRIPSHPGTLLEASETIEALEAELAQLKTVPTPPAASVPTPPRSTPTPKPAAQLPAARTATPPSTAWERELVRAHAAATADLSDKPITEQSIAQLRSALNAAADPKARAAIYQQLTARKAEAAAAKRNPLLRQARSTPGAAAGPAPNPPPAQAPAFDPEKDLTNFKRMEVAPPVVLKALPTSADTPYKVTEILKLTPIDDLLSMLSNPVHTDLQQSLIYAAVQERRAIERGRFQ
jgi:hypothetical protein